MKIGIIGFGPFAAFLSEKMMQQGHTVTATSRSDHSHLCSNLGVQFFREMSEFLAADNDVILLSMSIVSMEKVVTSVSFDKLTKPALIVDVLSVKEYPKDVLLKNLPEECDVLCTHPMFGPVSGKNGWQGLPFVYDKVRIRNHNLCQEFVEIFQKEGCRMVEMRCEEHDKLAAKTQFLTHTIGRVLAAMEIESTSMDTKGFESLLQLKDSTVRDSFDLYSGLFIHNKHAIQELEKLELAMKSVKAKLIETSSSRGTK